ncbi:MAG: NAD(P)-dependent oxidoreductase [Myxococcota bacterium]
MATIGFIGLGAMGQRMAAHLLTDQHELRVWNRNPAAAQPLIRGGAKLASSPREAAEGADFVISMVTDNAASRAVWLGEDGAGLALGPDAVAIESSTVSPDWARTLASELSAPLVEAPVSGSRPQADSAALVYFVAGEAAAIERAKPVLMQMGSSVHPVGAIGNAALIKLAVNALFASQVGAIGEILGMLGRAGISASEASSVLGALPITSAAAKGILALTAAENWDPLFPIDLVAKDMRYAVDVAEALGTSPPVLRSVRDAFGQAQDAGHGALNINGVAKLHL